jgi:excisionase family DNA binding protein
MNRLGKSPESLVGRNSCTLRAMTIYGPPMKYTLGTAAKATGLSKSTILRAIKSNKLSATKNEASGDWNIDPAELHRVYQPVAERVAEKVAAGNGSGTAFLIEELRQGWNRERALLERTIDELRNRLETTEEERRTTLRQLTALLADQRAAATPAPATVPETQQAPARRSWFGWRRGQGTAS